MSDTTDVLPDGARTASQETPVPVEATGSTPDTPTAEGAVKRRRPAGTGLASMLLPELQELAGSLGISGTGRLRKGQLIAAIQTAQGGGTSAPAQVNGSAPAVGGDSAASVPAESNGTAAATRQRPRRAASRPVGATVAGEQGTLDGSDGAVATADAPGLPEQRGAAPTDEVRAANGESTQTIRPPREERPARQQGDRQQSDRVQQGDRQQGDRQQGDRQPRNQQGQRGQQGDRSQGDRSQGDRSQGGDRGQGGNRNQNQNDRNDRTDRNDTGPDRDDDGSGNRRRGRFRERNRSRNRGGGGGQGGQGGYSDPDPVIREDDVLLPVAGILDVLDNYAFVRTSGYLTGSNDVYVSLAQVRRNGLRRGDAVTGAVRQPQEGERKDKYNALVRLDTVNGQTPEEARQRPEFTKLTPLYPQDRLRLETEASALTTRVIDLVMPIGKGQRALIVSPPKAGKTMVLQAIANAITTNNPECHLMVVLVDERPEEVTDMQRSVKGEVIASTFDRPPADHTSIAELSIERAKRLVELGHDVVVLLDSITRLGRAYNLAAPASGRILSGGVDSTALYPPKRFLGAARNIENGGSLTIIATALVETGSTMDTVIFEEFKGTGNAELKLDRKIADKRIFPAIDVDPSGTRKEEILLPAEELAIIHKLRRVLHALDSQQALQLVLERLKETKTNYEFLMQIARTTPGQD